MPVGLVTGWAEAVAGHSTGWFSRVITEPEVEQGTSRLGNRGPRDLQTTSLPISPYYRFTRRDWTVIALQQSRKVVADLGVNRRVDGIGWDLMPPPWHGRTFSVFLLAVDHFTRLFYAIAFLLEQFRFHGWTPLLRVL
jgi:hypothetical protein